MKKKIIPIITILSAISIILYGTFHQDFYRFNQVTKIQIERYIDSTENQENKTYCITITDKETIKDLTKTLKNWKWKKKEPTTKLYKINYDIKMNNGFSISFDSNFSEDSCFVTLNNQLHDGCVNKKFIEKLKTIIQKEYSKLQ